MIEHLQSNFVPAELIKLCISSSTDICWYWQTNTDSILSLNKAWKSGLTQLRTKYENKKLKERERERDSTLYSYDRPFEKTLLSKPPCIPIVIEQFLLLISFSKHEIPVSPLRSLFSSPLGFVWYNKIYCFIDSSMFPNFS